MGFGKDLFRNQIRTKKKQSTCKQRDRDDHQLCFPVHLKGRSGRIFDQVLRNQTQDGSAGSQDRENGRQHEKGLNDRHNAHNLRAIKPGNNNAGNKPQPGGRDPGRQGPGGTGEDLGKPAIRCQIMEFLFNYVQHCQKRYELFYGMR